MIKTRAEFKDAYAELQSTITTHKLTPHTHINQVLPVMVTICTQPQCTSMTLTEWELFKVVVRNIVEYVEIDA